MQVYTLLVVVWESYYSWNVLMKPLSPTTETPVLARRRDHLFDGKVGDCKKGLGLEKRMGMNILGECARVCYTENWESQRQIKPIDRWRLGLVVKLIHCVNSLNAVTSNSVTFWNQNQKCGNLFLHKNDEASNSSTQQFEESSPSPPPPSVSEGVLRTSVSNLIKKSY